QFPIEVLDTAWAFAELLVVAAGSRGSGKEQGTAKALTEVAAGVIKLIALDHAQAFGAEGHAIAVALALGMAVLVERDGGNAAPMHNCLVDVPGIKSRISGDMSRKEAQ